MPSATPTLISRLIGALTLGLGAATYGGIIPNKYAAYSALALAMVQAFQHPVQGTDPITLPANPPTAENIQKVAEKAVEVKSATPIS